MGRLAFSLAHVLTYRRLKLEEQEWHLNGLDGESVGQHDVRIDTPLWRIAFDNGNNDKTETYEMQDVSVDARIVETMHSTLSKRRSRYCRTCGSLIRLGSRDSDSAGQGVDYFP
jgi:hypothetical protein